jgi:two-component system, sensor histidine kinase and response regulator
VKVLMEKRSDCSVSILLVEDEEVALKLLARILATRFPKAVIHPACNGRAGLESFKEHRPELVITDLNMPEMSGAQMVEEIALVSPEAKIIVLTAGSEEMSLELLLRRNVSISQVINKPLNFAKLFAAIEACLARPGSIG